MLRLKSTNMCKAFVWAFVCLEIFRWGL